MSKKEVTKKVTNKQDKKEIKVVKKDIKKESKKEKQPTESFFSGVKKEMGKVRWPLRQEMIKYSVATLIFIVFFGLFFYFGDLIIAAVKTLVA